MSAVNKTIHEAMGLCWHEKIKTTKGEHRTCSCCDPYDYHHECPDCEFFSITDDTVVEMFAFDDDERPDYTDPVHYYNLFKWMRNDDRWRVFGNWLMRNHGDSQFRFLMKVEEHQIDHIAEAIEAGVLK